MITISTRPAIFYLLLMIFCSTPVLLSAQQPALSKAKWKILEQKEDSLKVLSRSMVFAESAADRFRADSQFVRSFVRALLVPYSFEYPFDSVNISKIVAPDSSFRIFTWQLKKDEYVYLQKGAIQMRTRNGQLKLFPLFDYSMFTAHPEDSVRDRNHWIGAIYYRIIEKEYKGKNYYTLIGFDDYNIDANKKWMEVLHFNDKGEPEFGGPFFYFKDDSTNQVKVLPRFVIEYKKEAKTFLNYDPELDLVIVDHLISETNEPEKKSTYIPDGDYEAFKWSNGHWVHINKQFTQKLKDGEYPKDALILDNEGNADEQKLEEASRRNMEKAKEKAEKNKPAPKKSGNL